MFFLTIHYVYHQHDLGSFLLILILNEILHFLLLSNKNYFIEFFNNIFFRCNTYIYWCTHYKYCYERNFKINNQWTFFSCYLWQLTLIQLEHQKLMDNNHNQNIEHYLENNSKRIVFFSSKYLLLRSIGVIIADINEPIFIVK